MVPIKNYETGSEFVDVIQNAGKTVNFFRTHCTKVSI